jgi:hypothetical protein
MLLQSGQHGAALGEIPTVCALFPPASLTQRLLPLLSSPYTRIHPRARPDPSHVSRTNVRLE